MTKIRLTRSDYAAKLQMKDTKRHQRYLFELNDIYDVCDCIFNRSLDYFFLQSTAAGWCHVVNHHR